MGYLGNMNDPNATTPSWQYDEMVQLGKDFADREVVAAYDAYHRRFRDIDGENAAILDGLRLQPSDTIADFGCGTGAFAIQAAQRCAKVHAIDVSAAMLDYTAWKAQGLGLTNVVCHHAGFLTYVHTGPLLDVATTSMVLHHLPDFWKQKALCRLNQMLKPGARLFLADVVFSDENYEANITAWLDTLTAKAGPEIGKDINRHVRKEHSTFTWILEGLLTRAGFRIDRAEYSDGVVGRYYCTKVGS